MNLYISIPSILFLAGSTNKSYGLDISFNSVYVHDLLCIFAATLWIRIMNLGYIFSGQLKV